MSTSPPSAGAARIDIADEIGRAYRAVIDNVRLVVEMAVIPLLIVLAAELVALFLRGGGIAGQALGALVEMVGFLVFGAVYVVRWHRYVLLGDRVSGGFIPPGWAPFFVAGLKVGGLVVLGWVVLVVIAVVPPHLVTMPLTVAGGIALTLAAMRVSLIFPAAAIERPVGLSTAWDWIVGNFWRLFVCLVVCYLPFVVVEVIVNAIAGVFPALLWIVFEALRLAVSFAGIAVVAALLSHLYREIVGDPSPSAAAA